MKINKIKSIILGAMVVTVMSSTPVFAEMNNAKKDSISVSVSQEEVQPLTVNISKAGAIGSNGMCVISGYAKNSDGTPLVNATIWITVEEDVGSMTHELIPYAKVHTDSNGYYSVKVYGREIGYLGYHTVAVYIDNGTDKNGTEIGHGEYEIEHNVWADIRVLDSIFISSHL